MYVTIWGKAVRDVAPELGFVRRQKACEEVYDFGRKHLACVLFILSEKETRDETIYIGEEKVQPVGLSADSVSDFAVHDSADYDHGGASVTGTDAGGFHHSAVRRHGNGNLQRSEKL